MPKSFPKRATEAVREMTHGMVYSDVIWRGRVIGRRVREQDSSLVSECQTDRFGRRHGFERDWIDGRLMAEAHWRSGREHGIIRQWDGNGKLLGTYRMRDGTGVDLWRDGDGRLSEEHHMRGGKRHGVERWWNPNNASVYIERYWRNGQLHGIERKWDSKGRLARGFPRFYVNGLRVSKPEYMRCSTRSRTLPRFDEAENTPQRKLPKEYTRQLRTSLQGGS